MITSVALEIVQPRSILQDEKLIKFKRRTFFFLNASHIISKYLLTKGSRSPAILFFCFVSNLISYDLFLRKHLFDFSRQNQFTVAAAFLVFT